MTPVNELREAASVLRQRAEHAQRLMPSPWRVVFTDSESADGVASCPLHAGEPDDACDSCMVVETYSEWVAPFMACLHPMAGLALADLFEMTAWAWVDAMAVASSQQQKTPFKSRNALQEQTLALARLILGRPT